MIKLNTIDRLDVLNRRVILRVDFNVTLTHGALADDTRIMQALPTISELSVRGATVILVTHLGRPNGRRLKRYSIVPVARRLQKLIKRSVTVIEDFTTDSGKRKLMRLEPGSLAMLENIRFYPGEERNDPQFSARLAQLGDVYVNDAFGTDHRVHASTVGVTNHLPSYAGRLLESELQMISHLVRNPKRPFVAVIGGLKAETKIALIGRLLSLVDQLLVGGAIANTFFQAWGFKTGTADVNRELVEIARGLIWKASQTNTALVFPQDVVVGRTPPGRLFVVASDRIPSGSRVLDIGLKTQKQYAEVISQGRTIVWNGPMGMFEFSYLREGSDAIYRAIAANKAAFSVVGGGETLSVLSQQPIIGKNLHISTGGGALLEFIEKGTLPAIEALRKKRSRQSQ